MVTASGGLPNEREPRFDQMSNTAYKTTNRSIRDISGSIRKFLDNHRIGVGSQVVLYHGYEDIERESNAIEQP